MRSAGPSLRARSIGDPREAVKMYRIGKTNTTKLARISVSADAISATRVDASRPLIDSRSRTCNGNRTYARRSANRTYSKRTDDDEHRERDDRQEDVQKQLFTIHGRIVYFVRKSMNTLR
ncbi:hypothetical protein D8S78_04970 [Natrialba swarupiae]|nr:hypothetical protein [Natrialba swarupiae]